MADYIDKKHRIAYTSLDDYTVLFQDMDSAYRKKLTSNTPTTPRREAKNQAKFYKAAGVGKYYELFRDLEVLEMQYGINAPARIAPDGHTIENSGLQLNEAIARLELLNNLENDYVLLPEQGTNSGALLQVECIEDGQIFIGGKISMDINDFMKELQDGNLQVGKTPKEIMSGKESTLAVEPVIEARLQAAKEKQAEGRTPGRAPTPKLAAER